MSLGDIVHSPSGWVELLFRDTSVPRLEALLTALSEVPGEVAAARAAHVEMLLGRAEAAAVRLEGLTARIAVAQRFLALAQLARDSVEPAIYARILRDAPKHFGPAESQIDFEAQMRLDFARGIANAEVGDPNEARHHLSLTEHVARLIGNAHLESAAVTVAIRSKEPEPESVVLERIMRRLAHLHVEDNAYLYDHLAVQACQSLVISGRFADIVGLGETLVSRGYDAAWWGGAARVIAGDVDAAVPDLDLAPTHPLMLYAHTVASIRAALRARDEFRPHTVAALAARAATLPAPAGSWMFVSGKVRALQVVALALAGDMRAAAVRVRELWTRPEFKNPSLRALLGAASLTVTSEGGGATAYDVREAVEGVFEPFKSLDAERAAALASCICLLMPNAAVALSNVPDAPGKLSVACTTKVAYFTSGGELRYRYASVPGYPNGDKARAALVLEEEGGDGGYPVARQRHREALAALKYPPVAWARRVAILAEHLRFLHFPPGNGPMLES